MVPTWSEGAAVGSGVDVGTAVAVGGTGVTVGCGVDSDAAVAVLVGVSAGCCVGCSARGSAVGAVVAASVGFHRLRRCRCTGGRNCGRRWRSGRIHAGYNRSCSRRCRRCLRRGWRGRCGLRCRRASATGEHGGDRQRERCSYDRVLEIQAHYFKDASHCCWLGSLI